MTQEKKEKVKKMLDEIFGPLPSLPPEEEIKCATFRPDLQEKILKELNKK